ncbi:hypothetical protein HGO34_18255 [Agrobacterium vitis]|uniref:Uncharacterized protein n=1 Tax=Agrobacterium vitis TaxID=373 RepID=A0AAE4WFU2_AGRVI|nr:hypothetical protein [Agrobacterium vitis]MCF1500267.1 hypothetical protein [Allorhizobium sp. Av2]MCM2441670.1 hypothetical protein [Agrobacterium vitis]MUZ58918.1 hypothetical protein [Agrobacterium vitis]MVA68024.1 hypothetical protein [Agrobacterium vitis]MVA88714.1 hypothetical protein [Agrobacterium vitis]
MIDILKPKSPWFLGLSCSRHIVVIDIFAVPQHIFAVLPAAFQLDACAKSRFYIRQDGLNHYIGYIWGG